MSAVPLIYNKNHNYRLFAISRHGNQMYGESPYAFHLSMVEAILEENSFDEYAYRAGAWLHDVVEDTNTSYSEVFKYFGDKVVPIVWACTGVGRNRDEKNHSIYYKMKKYPQAAPVKVADRIANVTMGITSSNEKKVSMYSSEWPEFKAGIEQHMKSDQRSILLWTVLEDLMGNVCRYF